MQAINRREFVQISAGISTGIGVFSSTNLRAHQNENTVKVLNPRGRVPLSFIIDDSTCLVNMGHYCMPQFAEAWPERAEYKKPWKSWPREIPDAFVREFGEWCGEHGVKGKYSIVPFPACVGWLDRTLPGWSRADLDASLKLVRDLMLPNWDIHPEMITHTRVIDLKTGRPMEDANSATMENSFPQEDKSVDELASYLAYALRILKNCGLPCEGITTPGGFGNRVKQKLPIAVHQSVRDVFGTELPHYFKYISSGKESTHPKLEFIGNNRSADELTVNVPAGTGDWFGGWDGSLKSRGHLYSNEDATSGRMVELIQRGEPAIMLCHWPGMYCNGTKEGFIDFKKAVLALHSRFRDSILWMKVSEIAKYAAAKELTVATIEGNSIHFDAPIACPEFTIETTRVTNSQPFLKTADWSRQLKRVTERSGLKAWTYSTKNDVTVICFDLPKGDSTLTF